MITSLVVLQPTNFCNLNCSYCYVPDRKNKQLMSDEVLIGALRCVFESEVTQPTDDEDIINFVWHAGEPLVAGIDFYKNANRLVEKCNIYNRKFHMGIQTNATLINDEWCDFFREYNYQATVSIDGPAHIHDRFRKTWGNKGSFDKAMQGVSYLKKHHIPLRSIAVLSDYSLDYPDEIFQFYKTEGFESISFNIDEQDGDNKSSSYGAALSGTSGQRLIERYKEFFERLYDLWDADGRAMEIREINGVGQLLLIKKHSPDRVFPKDVTVAFCVITISKDGNVTTFSPEMAGGTPNEPQKFVIGNVLNIKRFEELEKSLDFQQQLASITQGIKNCAESCDYFDLCGGGSPSNKFYEHGRFDTTETVECKLTVQVLTDVVLNKMTKPL